MDTQEELESLRAEVAELRSRLESISANEQFRVLVESAPNGIVVSDGRGRVVLANQRAVEMFGYSKGEFEGIEIEDLVPRRFRESHRRDRNEFHGDPHSRAMGAGRDLFGVRKGGKEFPVEIALTPLPTNGRTRVLASIIDITERKRSEEQLEVLSEILHNVHDAVFQVDRDGVVRDWNERAVRVFGVGVENAVGRPIGEVCTSHGGDPERHPFHDRIVPAIEATGSAEEIIHCRRPDGEDLFIRAKVRPMRGGEIDGYVVCASDITNEKRLEAELVRVSEREQQRIGQDIHDDLCSQLSGIGCLTKVLEQKLDREEHPDREMMGQISEMVADAGVRAREIAKGLVPTVLETRGLSGAIQELVERQRNTFGIDCTATIEDERAVDRLDPTTAVQLYRIVQEAVNNAVKHSDAEKIGVRVRSRGDEIRFRVSDDGKGMPPDSTSGGMGLLTMRRRAEIIDASFLISATIGEGTEICFRLKKEVS